MTVQMADGIITVADQFLEIMRQVLPENFDAVMEEVLPRNLDEQV